MLNYPSIRGIGWGDFFMIDGDATLSQCNINLSCGKYLPVPYSIGERS